MSQPPGTPTMVLRMSVPAGSAFSEVAADVAVKIAEFLGRTEPHASATGEAVKALAAKVAPAGTGGSDEITFEFHQIADELRIEARCAGRSSEARHPLTT
jgi:hypothetical protein